MYIPSIANNSKKLNGHLKPLASFFKRVSAVETEKSVSKSFYVVDESNHLLHVITVQRLPCDIGYSVYVTQAVCNGDNDGLHYEAYLKAPSRNLPLEKVWHLNTSGGDDSTVQKAVRLLVEDVVNCWLDAAQHNAKNN